MKRRFVILGLLASLLAAVTLPFAAATPADAALAGNDNMVYAFGAASYRGSTAGMPLAQPIIAMAQTADGSGYWMLADDGGVFSFGAPFFGSVSGFPLRLPATAMAASPDGAGYWIVTEDGGVFPFGSAASHGGLVGTTLNSPVADIISAPDGQGYWLMAEDGGVFSFGSAAFYGSTGAMRLNAPIVGMAAVPGGGGGYWLVGRDGGVFTFGTAAFYGSTGSLRLNAPVIGIARTASGKGYWLIAEDGGLFAFGDAQFHGSAAGTLSAGRRVTQVVGMPNGDGYRMLALDRPQDLPTARMGDRGAPVTEIQRRLESLGYWLGGANGEYGPLTQQAVWAFQKVQGLPRTGNVDLATRDAFRDARRPLPRSTSGYVAEVDKARQVVIIARNGRAELVFNTSTGTERPYTFEGVRYLADTPPGRFKVTSQVNGVKVGALGTLYRPKYFHPDGIAFHGYTSVPPTPASHGCVRLTNAAINFVWDANIIPMGTDIFVY